MTTATATASEALQERIESARSLHGELARAQKELEEVRASILARGEPKGIRQQFRSCQNALMAAGRLLQMDNRFRPRLPSAKREVALAMLRAGKRPIDLQRELGIDSNTARRMRHRELGDRRDLNRVCKLSPEQIAEVRAAGRATVRRHFAEKFGVSMSLISRVRNRRASYREVTKVPSVQTTTAKRPGPPTTTNSLSLHLSAELARSLAEMAALAHCEVATYATELLETGVADFRARNIPSSFMDLDATMPATADNVKPRGRFRGRFSADDRERINAQHDGGMTVKEIAQRWGCGDTTVRRALDCD